MNTHDFYFDLPENLIAQKPIEPRDHARLLCLNKDTGEIKHSLFYDLPAFLHPGDALIINDSKVLPARLYGTRADTGSRVEILLLEQKREGEWEIIGKPAKRLKKGKRFLFHPLLQGEIIQEMAEGRRLIRFFYQGNFYEILEKIGQMPLPPYIKETLQDHSQYQTVYAREIGSAAAPTAGLHFTDELLKRIRNKGIRIGKVTLHVGLGTFRPVQADRVEDHHMHAEHYDFPQETADLILQTKKAGKRVFAVGTTSCRTLETVGKTGKLRAMQGYTDIFIYPGYQFQVIDGLITNFHLPESTLMMLVSAFGGYSHIRRAYQEAIQQSYRFFSFGDAMLIV